MQFPRNKSYETLLVKIGLQVFCMVVKNHYVKKGLIGRMLKAYVSPICGEAPSNPIVTKCGLFVPFPRRNQL